MASTTTNPTGSRVKKNVNVRRLACIGLVFTGFLWVILGVGDLITMEKPPENFVATDAVVMSSDIESSSVGKTDAGDTPVYYNAVVSFQYTVKGETFTGRRLMGQARRNDPAEAQKIVESHPQGTLIPILYNPDFPGESWLDEPYLLWPATLIGGGVFSMMLAAGIFFFMPEPVPKPAPKSPRTPAPRVDTSSSVPDVQPSLSPELMQLQGTWSLLYQVPSMREIIAASRTSGSTSSDNRAVMSAGAESLTVTIGPSEMEFRYTDSKIDGSCDILSRFTCDGNRLDLEHVSMDFLVADVEGFPPTSYIFDLGSNNKLTLTSHGIAGLDGKSIVYILKRVEKET